MNVWSLSLQRDNADDLLVKKNRCQVKLMFSLWENQVKNNNTEQYELREQFSMPTRNVLLALKKLNFKQLIIQASFRL